MPPDPRILAYETSSDLRSPHRGIPGRIFVPSLLAAFLVLLGFMCGFLYLFDRP